MSRRFPRGSAGPARGGERFVMADDFLLLVSQILGDIARHAFDIDHCLERLLHWTKTLFSECGFAAT
jgi:hypothetical protein